MLSATDLRELDALTTAAYADRQIGLRLFLEDAWPLIEGARSFIPNWHLDAIADALMAVTREDLGDLVISMPPRLTKSTTVAVLWPCWEWGPAGLASLRAMFFTYSSEFTARDARRRRKILASPWFRRLWPAVCVGQLRRFQANAIHRYENTAGGFHQASSIHGAATGEGGERIIVDDPIKANEAHSDTIREAVNTWWSEAAASRRNPGETRTARVIVAQRTHERDLSGYLLAIDAGYEHLCLPMEFDPRRICVLAPSGSYPGFRDPRRGEGELLIPPRMIVGDPRRPPRERLTLLKRETGPIAWAAQYNQIPQSGGASILRAEWWRYWVPVGHPLAGKRDEHDQIILVLPGSFDQTLDSWDMAFKDTKESAFVVGGGWGRSGPNSFLRRFRRGRLSFTESLYAVQDMRRYTKPQAIYVEDKANGPAIISVLREVIPSILPGTIDPSDGGKVARAHAMSPKVAAGNFVLPHPSLEIEGLMQNEDDPSVARAVDYIRREAQQFPRAPYKDVVDMMTQAHKYLYLQEPFTDHNFERRDLGL